MSRTQSQVIKITYKVLQVSARVQLLLQNPAVPKCFIVYNWDGMEWDWDLKHF